MTQYTFAQVEDLWTGAGGSAIFAPLMAAVAEVESGLNSDNYNASGASGLWQIEVPLHDSIIPGGAANVFNPQANAQAAVTLSGNTIKGIYDNWLQFEPAGKAVGIATANGYTGPGAEPALNPNGTSVDSPASTSTNPLDAVSGTVSEMSTLLGDSAKALDWFFHFFKPGQGWRILLGAGAGLSAWGGVRAWMAAADSDDGSSALPLAVLLFGAAFLCGFMTLRQWPDPGGKPILPTAYAVDIVTGKPPSAGAPPGSDAAAIEAGLGALIALWGASKIASGLGGLSGLLGNLGSIFKAGAEDAAEAGAGE
jgi:hypothetical protein